MRTSWLGCRDRGVLGLLPSRSYRSKNNSIPHDQTCRLLFVTCIIAREITLSADRSIIRHLLPSDHLCLSLSSTFLLTLARACVFMFACACRNCARVSVISAPCACGFTSVRTCAFTSRVRIYLRPCACVLEPAYVCVQMCVRVRRDSCASRACRHLYCQCCRPAGAPPAQWTREHFRLSARSSSRRLYSTARVSTSTCRVIESLTAILHGRASAPLERRRGVTPSQCLHATRHGDQFLRDPCAFATARGLVALRENNFIRIITIPAGLPHL